MLLVRGPMVEVASENSSSVHHVLQALQWTYLEDEVGVQNDPELLYTNFGRQAKHRRTPLVQKFSNYWASSLNVSAMHMRGPLRLITGPDGFRRLHSSTPSTRVPRFDPFRTLPATLVGQLLFFQ